MNPPSPFGGQEVAGRCEWGGGAVEWPALRADVVKVGVFWLLYRYNAFNIKCDRLVDLRNKARACSYGGWYLSLPRA